MEQRGTGLMAQSNQVHMYQVIKRTGKSFVAGSEIIGTSEKWEDAYKIGLTVCADVANEPRKEADHYWFSDETNSEVGYKVHIQKI